MKTKMFFTAVFLSTAFVFISCVSFGQQLSLLEFTVVNKTGFPLEELYCSPAFSNFRGADLFNDNILKNGQSRKVSFMPQIFSLYWDICAVDADGTEYLSAGISFAKTPAVTLFYEQSEQDDQYESDDNFFEFSTFSLDTPE